LRLILNEFRRIIEQRLWLYLIPQFLQPLREAFFDAAVLAGKLEAPGYATDREDYVETLWVPEGWPYSHPVQDVAADRQAIRAGLKSRTSTILRNGDDPEQVAEEIERENTDGDARGFVFDSDPRKTSNAGLTQGRPKGTEIPATDISTGDTNPDPEPPPPQDSPQNEDNLDNKA
jgi:capsid protein